jgi:bis(5'-nucleosyl)-tetraphosphatase (symmetrical)
MAVYLIGDVQGCDAALERLLAEIAFSPSRDTLYLLGDLVNRGPASLAVLRRVMGLGDSARCILGNHDLHLLAAAHNIRAPHKSDTLGDILCAPDRTALLDWLRQQPLARLDFGVLMVHAGVLPAWTATKTIALATEVQSALQSPDYAEFLRQMYGNEPSNWSESLRGPERLRVIVNALTRLRFCSAQGQMEFASKEGAGKAPEGYMPWFEVPGRLSSNTPIACGHWSTLGLVQRKNLLCLDTGCVWGGCLSAYRVPENFAKNPDLRQGQVRQVQCEQAQKPS